MHHHSKRSDRRDDTDVPGKIGAQLGGSSRLVSGAQCPAPTARWRPLPADPAQRGRADKGGRRASPAGWWRRRAPRVAAAAPARGAGQLPPEPLSCAASPCLKDKARGRRGAGGASPASTGDRSAPCKLRLKGKRVQVQEWARSPNAWPRSSLPFPSSANDLPRT
jgi:hypothetical protein